MIASAADLLARLDDLPRWVETRAMLRSGLAAVSGHRDAGGFVVRGEKCGVPVISVIDRPARPLILAATRDVAPETPILAQTDNARWVAACVASDGDATWIHERAIVHTRPDGGPWAASSAPRVRLLEPADDLGALPPALAREMADARRAGPVAAAVEDGRPVSFCHASWRTESLWDVSVDTLEAYRGRGLAAAAAAFLIDHLRPERVAPVWGALESNTASLRVAARLGFAPVDAIVVFSRGPWTARRSSPPLPPGSASA